MNLDIKYKIVGRGEPILLIHGIPSTASLWDGLISLLSEEYTFVAINLPGFGGSGILPNVEATKNEINSVDKARAVKMEFLLERLNGIMQENGFEKYHLIGHSFGSAVSALLFNKNPENVISLFLSCPLTPIKPLSSRLITIISVYKLVNKFWAKSSNNVRIKILMQGIKRANNNAQTKQRADQIIDEICDAKLISNIYNLLSLLDVKTLEQAYMRVSVEKGKKIFLLGSQKDKVIPFRHFKTLIKNFDDSNVYTLANASHTPMNQLPNEFAKIINAHLAGNK